MINKLKLLKSRGLLSRTCSLFTLCTAKCNTKSGLNSWGTIANDNSAIEVRASPPCLQEVTMAQGIVHDCHTDISGSATPHPFSTHCNSLGAIIAIWLNTETNPGVSD